MQTEIPFHDGAIEAELDGEIWTVRLGELEASSKWLDFALSELLDDATQAHELAAKLVEQLLPHEQEAT